MYKYSTIFQWAKYSKSSNCNWLQHAGFYKSSCIPENTQEKRATTVIYMWNLPRWLSGKESACQCRRCKEKRVLSLGQEDLLEQEMVTHSSIPTWKNTDRRLVGYSPWGCRVRHDWVIERTHTHIMSMYVCLGTCASHKVEEENLNSKFQHDHPFKLDHVFNLICSFNSWAGKIPRRRECHLTLDFLPGEPYGQRSIIGCIP